MSISVSTRQAYSEIDEFIELLDEYNKNKIPKKLRDFFKKEKDINYVKNIDSTMPIKEQNLKEETLALIAMLNLQYWCEDENEKEKLREIYSQNESKYQEKLREKYNPDNIFKHRKNDNKYDITTNNEIAIIEYKKNSLFTKIKRFIKQIFRH